MGASLALTLPLLSFLCILIEGAAEEHRAHLFPSAKGQCQSQGHARSHRDGRGSVPAPSRPGSQRASEAGDASEGFFCSLRDKRN